MGFLVDKVSEDSFYENLLLGISKVLEKSPFVSNINLKRIPAVKQSDIRAWEHNNGVILPEDLRAFFSSTNGFQFKYEFSYDYTYTNEEEKDFTVGLIEINPINHLIRTFGYETKNVAQIQRIGLERVLTLSKDSKVFELVNVDNNNSYKVVLVYPTTYSVPSIWFYGGQMQFNYLAEDFTTYFRMCIAHLGIPGWQFAFSKEDLPEKSREMFNLLVPGILATDQNLIENHWFKHNIEHINKIDPAIFQNNIPSTNNNVPLLEKTHHQHQSLENNKTEINNKEKIKGNKFPPKRALSCKTKKGY